MLYTVLGAEASVANKKTRSLISWNYVHVGGDGGGNKLTITSQHPSAVEKVRGRYARVVGGFFEKVTEAKT